MEINRNYFLGHNRKLQEAEAVPDDLVPGLGQNQEENVVRQLFWDIEKVLGEFRIVFRI